MTATTTEVLPACRQLARTAGLVPALTSLCAETLPGMLPCGPAGHAVVPADVAVHADRVWQSGSTSGRATGTEHILSTVDLPEGTLTLLRHRPSPPDGACSGTGWELGLVWLRLGLSEGLRDACVRYLGDRGTGESTLLRRQLVQGAMADAVIEHVEVRAVLTGAATADVVHLHDQLTHADRVLLRLLGASSFLADGPGELAYLSELLAEAYTDRSPA